MKWQHITNANMCETNIDEITARITRNP